MSTDGPVSGRDYQREFVAFVAARRPRSEYAIPALAGKVFADLEAEDPDLLRGWLYDSAPALIAQWLGRQDSHRRQQARLQQAGRRFADAAAQYAAGDGEAMSAFAAPFVVNDELLRRAVGDMTKVDHLYVAAHYQDRANGELFEAAFHRAVAKKIPAGKTTADVFTEQQYLELRASIRPQ